MRRVTVACVFVLCLIMPGCGSESTSNAGPPAESAGQTSQTASPSQGTVATAELQPASGSQVKGTVTFERMANNQVRVTAHVTGLTPGQHGFHIHEKGDCSAPDATSAGAHYNPASKPHGDPSPEHHMGDLGNLEANASGEAHVDMTVDFLSMEGANSVVGKAVLVHANPDDLKSQPAGNAGARVACGVIEIQREP